MLAGDLYSKLFFCTAIILSIPASVVAQAANQEKAKPVVKQVSTTNNPAKDAGLQLTGRFQLIEGSNRGVLILKAVVPKGSYTYSVSQPKGGPPATKIKTLPDDNIRIKGQFVADKKPIVIEKDEIFKIRIEKHRETVQFFVPIEIHPDADPSQIRPVMQVSCQVCSDIGLCSQIRNRKIAAEFAGYYKQQAQTKDTLQNTRR